MALIGNYVELCHDRDFDFLGYGLSEGVGRLLIRPSAKKIRASNGCAYTSGCQRQCYQACQHTDVRATKRPCESSRSPGAERQLFRSHMRRPATNSEPAPTGAATPVMVRSGSMVWEMAALLVLLTVATYWPVMSHDFVNYDDNVYVTANVHVQNGLTLENIKWAGFNPVGGNWHPLTVWSHMADCQLFGLKSWGHHLTSVLLHALNTVLVFLFLRRLTGAFWRSALVAALFGLHPLHVESVAWVAERKDVLSTCFGLLSLIFTPVTGESAWRLKTGTLRPREFRRLAPSTTSSL